MGSVVKWSNKIRAAAAASRLLDEELYARAFKEIEQGFRRDGLWAKAFADGEGDEARAKALYVQYRVQSFKDEMVVHEHAIASGSRALERGNRKSP